MKNIDEIVIMSRHVVARYASRVLNRKIDEKSIKNYRNDDDLMYIHHKLEYFIEKISKPGLYKIDNSDSYIVIDRDMVAKSVIILYEEAPDFIPLEEKYLHSPRFRKK